MRYNVGKAFPVDWSLLYFSWKISWISYYLFSIQIDRDNRISKTYTHFAFNLFSFVQITGSVLNQNCENQKITILNKNKIWKNKRQNKKFVIFISNSLILKVFYIQKVL